MSIRVNGDPIASAADRVSGPSAIAGLPSRLVILDTEYTAWEGSKARQWSGKGEHRELVELAAIRVDRHALEEIASFRRLVRPRFNVRLSDYLVRLTGITQAELDQEGVDACDAITAFADWAGADAIYCFGNDGAVIRENITLYGLAPEIFPPPVTDIRSAFLRHGIDMTGLSSGTATRAFGHEPLLAPHSGLNDVRTILEALRLLSLHAAPRDASEERAGTIMRAHNRSRIA